ncbi:MAG TPA: HD domain-containing protein [Clostridia bacterium]|nr:HD domain-containing protein [Clostridia bacterium]
MPLLRTAVKRLEAAGVGMEGIQFNRRAAAEESAAGNEPSTQLLTKQGDLEVILHRINGESVVWLFPASDPNASEYFFIHAGGVDLAMDDGLVSLGAGDSFIVSGLKRDVPVKMHGDAEILYVTNCPAFEAVTHVNDSLQELLTRINEKDHYTSRHSKAVLQYSLALYDAMQDRGPDIPRDDLAFAALFHDVGKCFVPTEILQKPDKLEQAEMRYILRHPIDSGRMLLPNFGEQIAEIARNHHERLDGSGYPRGLRSEDISLSSQIVAVADVFDAMTSDRGYNVVKTYTQAAEELASLSHQFDSRITSVLMHLVSSGALEEGVGSGA